MRENELLIIQSLLNQDFFVDLVPINDNDFVNTVSYDTINPDNSVSYASVIDITKEDIKSEVESDSKFLKKNKDKKISLKVISSKPTFKTILTDSIPDELTPPLSSIEDLEQQDESGSSKKIELLDDIIEEDDEMEPQKKNLMINKPF